MEYRTKEKEVIRNAIIFTNDWMQRNKNKGKSWLHVNLCSVICNSLKPLQLVYGNKFQQRFLKPKYFTASISNGFTLNKLIWITDSYANLDSINQLIQEVLLEELPEQYKQENNLETVNNKLNLLKNFKF